MTLVLCVAGSETDQFCRDFLVPLIADSNPFLCREGPNNFCVATKSKLHIEIFFTEHVPLEEDQKGIPVEQT